MRLPRLVSIARTGDRLDRTPVTLQINALGLPALIVRARGRLWKARVVPAWSDLRRRFPLARLFRVHMYSWRNP